MSFPSLKDQQPPLISCHNLLILKLSFLLLLNTKVDILKDFKQLIVAIDFHRMGKNIMEVNGFSNCLVTSILQNIFFLCLAADRIQIWNKQRVIK